MQDAKFLKPLLLGKVASPLHTDEHAEELFGITVKEAVEKNWLEGPYSVSQVDAMFDRWLPVRQFSVFQRGKVRPIHDMKENRLKNVCLSLAVRHFWIIARPLLPMHVLLNHCGHNSGVVPGASLDSATCYCLRCWGSCKWYKTFQVYVANVAGCSPARLPRDKTWWNSSNLGGLLAGHGNC